MIASMATVPGREKQCLTAARSIRLQARTIVWGGSVDGRTDDARKFAADWKMPKYSGYILTVDDDLEYPADYAEYMVGQAEKHGCPVSLMGRIVLKESKSYYRDTSARIKHDWRTADGKAERVHIPGTGVLCYHTDYVRFSINDFPYPNMADIHVGVKCNAIGVPIMRVPPPRPDWIRYLEVPDTIYDKHRNDDRIQTDLVNQQAWR